MPSYLLLLPLLLLLAPAAYSHSHSHSHSDDPWLSKFGPLPDLGYTGIVTFAHLPHTKCLDNPDVGFDVAVLGVPFDGAVSYRPGARFGPFAIRSGSRRQNTARGYTSLLQTNPYNALEILDCGDIPLTPYSPPLALLQITTAYASLLSRTPASSPSSLAAQNWAKGLDGRYHPRIVSLGGDHTIVLPILEALSGVYGPVSVIHFDAHIDTWNPARYPGATPDDRSTDINHGTFFWEAYQKGYIKGGSNIHAGIRCRFTGPEDLSDDITAGFTLIHTNDIDTIGVAGISRLIHERVGDGPVVVSLDIDVLDPAFAPATGTPETGGWTSRELRQIIHSLKGLNIVAFDVVEVSPGYDTQAEITGIAAADLVFDFLSVLSLGVDSPSNTSAPAVGSGGHVEL